MLIALLAILGVDLIVIVAFGALVVAHKRWVMRQPGAFPGVIRLVSGEVDGLRPKWSRGSGRWVRDFLRGGRDRSFSEATCSLPTVWRINGLPAPMKSSGSETVPS